MYTWLGVDGGGTKTAAVLVDEKGREIARAVSGSSNVHAVGLAVAEDSLRAAIEGVLSAAGLTAADVAAVGLGLAGAGRPADRRAARDLLARIAAFRQVVVTHDAEAALVGGVGRRYGLVLIAGTGAMAYGVNAQGASWRADGWGYLLGDGGSAYWIGRAALRAVTRAHDGRGPGTALTAALLAHLALPDAEALVARVYAPAFGVPQVAALAPLVDEAAHSGDAVAQDILRQAGQQLATTAGAVIHRLALASAAFEVVLLGGVLRAGGAVRETVIAALGEMAPQAQPIEPRRDAAVGAALLAKELGEW